MAPVSKFLTRIAVVVALIAATASLPPSRLEGASASLGGAFGGHAKARTTSGGSSADLQARSAQSQVGRIPQRIISLVPATTEMLFMMGASNRIAGVSDYDRFPRESKLPTVGGLLTLTSSS
jgi:ABC-type Fe3+-hydroxamate transport system substrate-binding protein